MFRPKFILMSAFALSLLATGASAQSEKTQPAGKPGNPLVTALWFSHLYATPQALTPGKDRQLKLALIAALRRKPDGLSWDRVSDVFEKSTFQKIAGDGDKITLEVMVGML